MDEFEQEFAPDLLVDKTWWMINSAMWEAELVEDEERDT